MLRREAAFQGYQAASGFKPSLPDAKASSSRKPYRLAAHLGTHFMCPGLITGVTTPYDRHWLLGAGGDCACCFMKSSAKPSEGLGL